MIKQTQSFPAAVPFFHLQSCLVSLSYFVNQSSFLSQHLIPARHGIIIKIFLSLNNPPSIQVVTVWLILPLFYLAQRERI